METCLEKNKIFSSVQFSRSVMSNCDPLGLQHTRLPCPSPTRGACSNQWTHVHGFSDAIQPSHSLLSPSPPAFNLSQSFPVRVFSNESVLSIRLKNIGTSAASSVLPMNMQDWFPLFWLVWSPCSQRDSITPQFKGINSLALSFLYSLTQTSINDSWNKL